jgi:MFS family permease
MCYLGLGVVLPILPPYLTDHAHDGPFLVGLAVGAPALTAVVVRPLAGRWADRAGPARVMLAGALVMAAGGLALLMVSSTATLVGARLLVGVGEGAMMAAGVLWLLQLAGPHARGRSLGHLGLANYGGLSAGPLLAVTLGGTDAYRTVFLAAALSPLVGAALAIPVGGRVGGRVGIKGPHTPDRSLPVDAERWPVTGVLLAGAGLALVNVGYVALLSFGAQAASAGGGYLVATFGGTVVAVRGLGGGLPDRLGAAPVLVAAALAEAAGLAALPVMPNTAMVLGATMVLAAGQAFAVPALGILALRQVPASRHGVASGLFFAFFDIGVGLGGPAAGLLAKLSGPESAIEGAALTVALVTAVPLLTRNRRDAASCTSCCRNSFRVADPRLSEDVLRHCQCGDRGADKDQCTGRDPQRRGQCRAGATE